MDFKILANHYDFFQLSSTAVSQNNPVPPGAFIITMPNDCSIMAPGGIQVPGAIQSESDWRCLELCGEFAFDQVGVAAGITGCLARVGISLLVFSGYKTDYFFVKATNLKAARQALEGEGHRIVEPA